MKHQFLDTCKKRQTTTAKVTHPKEPEGKQNQINKDLGKENVHVFKGYLQILRYGFGFPTRLRITSILQPRIN